MLENRVLITSVGRKVSLVKAFKEAGWYVIGHDWDKSVVGLKFCDEIAGEHVEHNLLIPTRDAELKSGTFRSSDEVIDTCVDKYKFYKWCKANGFNTPEVYFVKPRISKSGKEIECVWQELLEGEEYSIDCFSDLDGNVISIVPRLRLKTVSGESVVTQTVSLTKSIEESISLSNKLKLVGHSVMQMFMVNGVPIWTDINCRFGGASIVGIEAGCKSPEWMLRILNGQEVKPCIGKYQVGLRGMSYSEWAFDGAEE